MKRKIFMWLLKQFTEFDRDRIAVLRFMDTQVHEDYDEQTPYGNVYNYFIEFIVANQFISDCIARNSESSLKTIKRGMSQAFDEAATIIKNEQKHIGY
jgi:hypothetical protein